MNNVGSFYAISIRQPWAELILCGSKTIEVRSWDSTYRGNLYLHTGKIPDPYKTVELGLQELFRGGYIGTIELASIVPFTPELWVKWKDLHLSNGQFREGLFAWMLRKPRRFKLPVSAPGRLGIFQPEPSVATILENSQFLD